VSLNDRVAKFLARSPFAKWSRVALAGDASGRNYQRLTGPIGQSAIVLDAPPGSGETLGAFLKIGDHLRGIGLCAPEILFADTDAGLLVISDLGPDHFAQWLRLHPGHETELYAAAVDVLAVLRKHPAPPGLTALTPAHAARMIGPLIEWYAPAAPLDLLVDQLEQALVRHAPQADTLALRDYHAENLIWRPDRHGLDRVGLLDYQDAVLAPAEYDLVSLLRDARRDVAEPVADAMIARFALQSDKDIGAVQAAVACLGVQRNLRILGIFARHGLRGGRTRYLELMPRVWGHLQTDLAHPALAGLAPLIAAHIPAPL
jgi:N-acetylmuramate 1-kinase